MCQKFEKEGARNWNEVEQCSQCTRTVQVKVPYSFIGNSNHPNPPTSRLFTLNPGQKRRGIVGIDVRAINGRGGASIGCQTFLLGGNWGRASSESCPPSHLFPDSFLFPCWFGGINGIFGRKGLGEGKIWPGPAVKISLLFFCQPEDTFPLFFATARSIPPLIPLPRLTTRH